MNGYGLIEAILLKKTVEMTIVIWSGLPVLVSVFLLNYAINRGKTSMNLENNGVKQLIGWL